MGDRVNVRWGKVQDNAIKALTHILTPFSCLSPRGMSFPLSLYPTLSVSQLIDAQVGDKGREEVLSFASAFILKTHKQRAADEARGMSHSTSLLFTPSSFHHLNPEGFVARRLPNQSAEGGGRINSKIFLFFPSLLEVARSF